MTQKISKMMNDSPLARWTVLVLVALMMFFAYMFVDVMSPLKSLVESKLGWDSGVFGKYAASEYILNVCGFLILAGIILDKLGVRFSGILSAGRRYEVHRSQRLVPKHRFLRMARQLVGRIAGKRQNGFARIHDFRMRM